MKTQVAPYYSGSPSEVDQRVFYGNPNKPRSFAQHQLKVRDSVGQLRNWMAEKMPDAYNAVMAQSPDLLSPTDMSLNGIVMEAGKSSWWRDDDTLVAFTLQDADAATADTSWGSRLLQIVQQAVPLVGQYKVMKLNIQRAEKGYPPLDPAYVTPGFTMGLDRSTSMLAGGLGIGTIAVIGLAAVLLLRRR